MITIISIHNKQHRKIVESCIISYYNTIKQRPSFFNLSPSVKLILNKLQYPLFKLVFYCLMLNYTYIQYFCYNF